MTMTDPIADMLTRIRNANAVSKTYVDVPYSKFKEEILKVLKEEKYIKDYEVIQENSKKILRVYLLYYGKRKAITEIKKISTPGRRIYVSKDKIPVIKNNYGIAVLTTSKGVMSNKKAKELGIGGELLFYVW
ncbi:MAG: 30S ribosomal protein S8 [candidate division WOR-3 bacterium]|nr:30S ribosomal protein S8 [Candidatus Omnitrophota bacterium]MCM8807260.1 30S ribosomal protein S8 [Candidatus Omnitrophota bacterium]